MSPPVELFSSSSSPGVAEERERDRQPGQQQLALLDQQFRVSTKVIMVVVTNLVAAERRSQLAATRWRGRRGQLSSCGQERDRDRGGDDDNYVLYRIRCGSVCTLIESRPCFFGSVLACSSNEIHSSYHLHLLLFHQTKLIFLHPCLISTRPSTARHGLLPRSVSSCPWKAPP